jgi:hypothetical protein
MCDSPTFDRSCTSSYAGDETRQLALDRGYVPVVPPMSNRLDPWEYEKAMYRKRNEVERLFG